MMLIKETSALTVSLLKTLRNVFSLPNLEAVVPSGFYIFKANNKKRKSMF